MIWLGSFLAIGIHFILFSIVHGKLMLLLAVLTSTNVLLGICDSSIHFETISMIDVVIKLAFGFVFLFSKRPGNIIAYAH